jgi:arylsulfatase A-like enzyme
MIPDLARRKRIGASCAQSWSAELGVSLNRRGIEHRSSPRASSPAAARAVSTGMSWEIDWSVGRVVATLRKLGLDKRTIVVFLSDNGPWALFDEQSGSAGPFRGSKGGTMEGGVRVPAIFWGPGIVRPGVITDMGSTLDLVPTLCTLTGARAPQDRTLDGYDLSAVLRQGARSPRETMFFYRQTEARN